MGKALTEINTLYVAALLGEPEFGRRLLRDMQQIGYFELTYDRTLADAELEADGEDTDDGFHGAMVIRDRQGATLWQGEAMRPHGSPGPMAYELLLDQLRAALPPTDRHTRIA